MTTLDSLESKDICEIDANISSLEQLFPQNVNEQRNTTSIRLHFNNISKLNNSIFHLLPRLVKLDLSANKLDNSAITVLGTIPCALENLNLSSNYQITSISDLFQSKASTLSNTLKFLDASFNFISDQGLENLSNSSCLSELYLQGNSIVNLEPMLGHLAPVKSLRSLFLQRDARDKNPCCDVLGYRKLMLHELSQLCELDELGEISLTKPNPLVTSILNTVHVAELEGSTASHRAKGTEKRGEEESEQRALAQSERSDSPTSFYTAINNYPSYRDTTPTMQMSARSRIPVRQGSPKSAKRQTTPKTESSRAGSEIADGADRYGGAIPVNRPTYKNSHKSQERVNQQTRDRTEHAYKLAKDLENEKHKFFKVQERMLKNDHVMSLKLAEITSLKNEIEILTSQSKKLKNAVFTSKKLLDNTIAERDYLSKQFNSNNSKLKDVRDKTEEISKFTSELEENLKLEKGKNGKLIAENSKLRENIEASTIKAEEIDHLKRREQYLKSEQEMEIKKVKNSILDPENDDFKLACSKVLKSAEERMRSRLQGLVVENKSLVEKYRALEDEFREGLIGESGKFGKLEGEFRKVMLKLETTTSEKATIDKKFEIQTEKFKDNLIIIKEVKAKLEGIQKGSHEKDEIWKSRVESLEKELTAQRKLANLVEPLRIEKSRLLSRITAHESIMDGLKMERKKWTEDLTAKGFELSNERGRLEAKISSQKEELERLQKLNGENLDVIRVKSILVDDQTKTVRELKDKIATYQSKQFEQQNSEKLQSEIRKLNSRKEELKYENSKLLDQVANFQHRWKEKEMILEQLEDSIKKMKKRDSEKMAKLTDEKTSLNDRFQKSEVLCQKLEDRFRQQMFLKEASYKKSVEVIKGNHDKEIDFKNDQILKVENEMRELLMQTDKERREMDEKYKKVGAAFNLLKQGLSSGPLL